MQQRKPKSSQIIIPEIIERKIFFIRDKKVMIDRDLAYLYGVETRVLNQAVKRNMERFPNDFMFQLTNEETKNWISQFVISKKERMGIRRNPLVFTDYGILMLSSVLSSKKAIQVNIQIMRTFTKLRELMLVHKDLRRKIEVMERKYDTQFQIVFRAIKKLIDPPKKPKAPFGFTPPGK